MIRAPSCLPDHQANMQLTQDGTILDKIVPDRERLIDTMLADIGDIIRKLTDERRRVADLDFPEFRDAADDVFTHYDSWMKIFVAARTPYIMAGDGDYWEHEFAAFKRTLEQFQIAFPQGYERPINPPSKDDLNRHIQKIGYYARHPVENLSPFEIKQVLVSALGLVTALSPVGGVA